MENPCGWCGKDTGSDALSWCDATCQRYWYAPPPQRRRKVTAFIPNGAIRAGKRV